MMNGVGCCSGCVGVIASVKTLVYKGQVLVVVRLNDDNWGI